MDFSQVTASVDVLALIEHIKKHAEADRPHWDEHRYPYSDPCYLAQCYVGHSAAWQNNSLRQQIIDGVQAWLNVVSVSVK